MTECITFEYDLSYSGGDYNDVGIFVHVPVALINELGPEAAFNRHTGVDQVHIIHYSNEVVHVDLASKEV